MKKFIKFISVLSLILLAAYAVYLLYDKFIKKPECEEDDLEDWGFEFEDEEPATISFTDRIRSAAERQLAKVR